MNFFNSAAFVVSLCALVTLGPVPLIASDNETGEVKFEVQLRSGAGGRNIAHVVITSADGDVIIDARTVIRGDEPIQLSTTHGPRTYKVEIKPGTQAALAMLEVLEGTTVIQQTARPVLVSTPPPILQSDPSLTGYQRVGGGITAPVLLSRIEPVYPHEAKEARVSGIVIIEVAVDETGAVRHANVLKPLPFGLNEAALEAVRQWQFAPALQEGKPVPVLFNLTVNFRLD